MPKSWVRKTYDFIFHEDSWLSWTVSIVLAFIFIKFLLYPGIGLLLNTGFPIVAVMSGSMEHKIAPHPRTGVLNACGIAFDEKEVVSFEDFWNYCGDWYVAHNISKAEFRKFNFRNGFDTGDIIFIYGPKPEKVKAGDVIVFKSLDLKLNEPIIHRVVKSWEENGTYYYQTKGDHNPGSDPEDELKISEDRLYGKAWFRIPWLGYVKIWFVGLINVFR